MCLGKKKKNGLQQKKLRHFSMTKLYSQAKVSLPRRVSEDNKCDHKERMPDESLTMDENHEAD